MPLVSSEGDSSARPSFGSLVRDARPAFFTALFVLFWSYGFLIFNFSISVDEELHLSGMPGLDVEWLRSGRWTIYFLKAVMSGMEVVPFFTGTLAVLFLAGATALLQMGFRSTRPANRAGWGDWVIGALVFPTTPVFVFSLCFATFDAAIGFGVFLALLSAVLAIGVIHRGRPLGHALLAVVLLAAALGVYQPMLILWAGAMLSFQLSALVMEEADVAGLHRGLGKFALHLFALCVGGLVLYKVTDWTVTHFAGKSAYFEGYLNWPRISLRAAAAQLFASSKGFLFGSEFQAGAGWRALLWIDLVSALIILVRAWRRRVFWLSAGFLLALLVLPFALSWVLGLVIKPTGYSLPIRTFFPVAISLAAPMIVAWPLLRRPSLRVIFLVAVALAVVANIQWINRTVLADFRRYQHDVFLAQQIGAETEKRAAVHGPTSVRLAVIGMDRANGDIFGYKYEVLGFSLFEWDEGNPYRVVALLRSLGFEHIEPPTSDDLKRAIAGSAAMDTWPAASSIQFKDGLVTVKLSAPTSQQMFHYAK